MCEILKLEPNELLERMEDETVWDSLKRIEIIFAVEEELGVHFTKENIVSTVSPVVLLNTAKLLAEKL